MIDLTELLKRVEEMDRDELVKLEIKMRDFAAEYPPMKTVYDWIVEIMKEN